MWNRIKNGPSPAMVVASVALVIALTGSAFAALGRNTVSSRQIKNNSIKSKDLKNDQVKGVDVLESSLGTVPSAANAGHASSAGRWALIAADGSIIAQSGGISVTSHGGGNYYLNFGSSQAGRSVQVTPVYRDADPGFGVSAVTTICGGGAEGATCTAPGTNNANHIYVGTSDAAANPDDQAFYITVD
jgi:hypothetical protein